MTKNSTFISRMNQMLIFKNEPININEYFEPFASDPDRSFVEVAEKIERTAQIENHPFFDFARQIHKLYSFGQLRN